MSKFLLDESTVNQFVTAKGYPELNNSQTAVMKTLLRNQGVENERMMNESTMSADIASFTPILVPVIRRAYPALIGTEIAGTQALKTPTGLLYALTTNYTGNGQNPINPNAKSFLIEVAGDETATFTLNTAVNFTTATTNDGNVRHSEFDSVANVTKVLVEPTTAGAVVVAVGDTANTKTVTGVFVNEALWLKVLKNYSGPHTTAEGEALGLDMKELGFTVSSTTATAKTRKLKGVYTVEMLQDLKAQHGIDAEKELAAMLSNEISLEVDRSIIDKANQVATVVSDFSHNTADGRWEIEKARILAIKIANEAREIGRQTRKGAGNKLVVSPKVASMLDQLGSYVIAPVGKTDSINSGIKPGVGKFDNRYDVIVDNFADFEYVTVACKNSNYDAGIFYAPYNITFQNVIDPVTGKPGIILINRYDVVANPLHAEAYIRRFGVNFTGSILA